MEKTAPTGECVSCNRCGTTISSRDEYCAYCGAKQHIAENGPSISATTIVERMTRDLQLYLLILI